MPASGTTRITTPEPNKSHQHVPADHRRLRFLRRSVTVLAILQAA